MRDLARQNNRTCQCFDTHVVPRGTILHGNRLGGNFKAFAVDDKFNGIAFAHAQVLDWQLIVTVRGRHHDAPPKWIAAHDDGTTGGRRDYWCLRAPGKFEPGIEHSNQPSFAEVFDGMRGK